MSEWPINKKRRRLGLPPITQCEVAPETEESRTIASLKAFRFALDVIGRQNSAMPQSTKERQEALRSRRAMLGMTEVRGIYLPPELHAALKAHARKLLKEPNAKTRPTPVKE